MITSSTRRVRLKPLEYDDSKHHTPLLNISCNLYYLLFSHTVLLAVTSFRKTVILTQSFGTAFLKCINHLNDWNS